MSSPEHDAIAALGTPHENVMPGDMFRCDRLECVVVALGEKRSRGKKKGGLHWCYLYFFNGERSLTYSPPIWNQGEPSGYSIVSDILDSKHDHFAYCGNLFDRVPCDSIRPVVRA